MTNYENAIGVMKELFGRDYQFALSTAKNNIPSSRYVDTYFDGKSFYVVTHRLSKKAVEIAENPNISLCCQKMHAFNRQAKSIGHPLNPDNADIRSALTKAFEPWFFKHNNEADENMRYVRIDPTAGFFHKDGIGYKIDFTKKAVKHFRLNSTQC